MPVIQDVHNKICYEAYGNPCHPCIILVSGITSQLTSWPTILIDGLVSNQLYVIIFDNRDVGFSKYYDYLSTPDTNTALGALQLNTKIELPYTLGEMAQDIEFLMDSLSIDSAHLLGISMGGQIAQLFAIKYLERLKSLILIATSSGDKDLPPPTDQILEFFFKKRPQGDLESTMASHLEQKKIYTHPDNFDLEDCKAKIQSDYHRSYHPAGNQRQLLAMMFAQPRGAQLKTVTVPSLILHGVDDPVFPVEHGRYLHQCLSNSRLVEIDKMGHTLSPSVASLIVKDITGFIVSYF
jgi:pimeloyl-ACP methyl ester carboxylesterase